MTKGKVRTGFFQLTSHKVALLYFALATAWILGSGYLVEFSTEDQALRAKLELVKGMFFVFFTSGLLYILLRIWHLQINPEKANSEFVNPLKNAGIILLFVVLVLSVPLLGFAISKYYEPRLQEEAFENLQAVAKLQKRQIEHWLAERRADAMTVANRGSEFVKSVKRMKEGDDTARAYVSGRLRNYKASYQYDAILVVDSAQRIVLSEGEDTKVDEALAQVINRVMASGVIANTNFYRSLDQDIHMDWVVPVFDSASEDSAVIAVVVMRTEPQQFIYPLLSDWPSAATTAESALIRQERDGVMYLNNLKHQPEAGLSFILPLATESLDAARAIQEQDAGVSSGVDYAGHRVLSAYEPIAGTDWYLLTSIHRDEVFSGLAEGLLLVTMIASGLVMIISLTLLLLWRQQSRLQQLQMMTHKSEVERLQSHFFNMPFIGMAVISPESKRFTQFNDHLCQIIGYSREELMQMSCLDCIHPDDMEADMYEFKRILAGESEGYVMDKRYHRKDGALVHATVDTRCVRKEDGTVDYLLCMAYDITRQKTDAARIMRLTQLHAALSACNQAIVRCTSEAELFESICQHAVVHGGMKMSWIGIVNQESKMVEPVASFGDDIGYLQDIKISASANSAYGRGPTGSAIRNNQPYWCQDFMDDPNTIKWRERSKGAWGSSATIPISRGGCVVGAFCLYSPEKHAFDADARALLIEMAMDITFALDNFDKEVRRTLAESRLTESESKFHLLFDQSLDGLLVIDGEEIVECNAAALNMMGCSEKHILHTPAWSFSPVRQPDGLASESKMRQMLELAKMEGRCRFEWMHRRLSGEDFPAEVSMVLITLNGKQVFYTTWRDISEQKNAEARIRHLAQYDVLTNLPNRTLLTDRVNQAINIAQRNQQKLSLMFLDLDRFKNVNDSLGHGVGDELLIQVAKRLHHIVREQDTVSRIGGDEFVLLLLDTNVDGASRVAEKMMQAIAKPYHIQHHEINVTPSIGIAIYPNDGEHFDDLLKSADIAMYRAKQSGRNSFQFFTPKMQEESVRIMQLTTALHHAITLNQFTLRYQPQRSLRDNSIVGVEALLRWEHPEFGLISPTEFIPIAEDTGDILDIGEWVIQQSLRQIREWQQQGLPLFNLAVNLSAVQFRHPNLPETVARLLEEADLPPEILELELTESVSMDDPVAAIAVMDKLSALGVRMSIDDFGTGYSSLNYLKRFKVDKLKIDQSFVRDIMTDQDDRAIVQSIISLSKSLGKLTIAEGVETAEQFEFLKACDCDEVQGYYFSKPLLGVEMQAFYQQHFSQGSQPNDQAPARANISAKPNTSEKSTSKTKSLAESKARSKVPAKPASSGKS